MLTGFPLRLGYNRPVLDEKTMTLEELRTLFAYDAWANGILLGAIERLPAEKQRLDLKASHRNLFGTMVHVVAAEEIWLSRWKGAPRARLTREEDVPDPEALRRWWNEVMAERDGFAGTLVEGDLDREMEMSTASGALYRHRFDDMFRHVVNHSSYHRGQLVTMLRQLGETPPATDFIRFLRENPR
jgi:uncharacterized damage-inducible protein DinB